MKIYFHLNIGGICNTYVVVNEETKEALIVDPGSLNPQVINQIETEHYNLVAVLITHNHASHINGLKTLMRIYSPKIYSSDWEILDNQTEVITGDGKIRIPGMSVNYYTVPGHTADSMVYKIGNVLFTGDSLSAGKLGTTNSSYSKHILKSNLEEKILSQEENTVVLPGHGPPTTIGAELNFNIHL